MSSSSLNVTEAALEKFAKLKLADRARLMTDNQAVLEGSRRSDDAHRDYTQRVREAQAKKVFGSDWDSPTPSKSGDDQMQIFIDSPITVAPVEPTPPAPTPEQPTQVSTPTQPVNGKKSWLLPLALAGAMGSGAAIPLAYLALRPGPEPQPTVTAPGYRLPAMYVEKWVPANR
jgi:hypothetical protein